MESELIKTKCWHCKGKGWQYWSFVDAFLDQKEECKTCNATGVIFRRAPIHDNFH